MYELSLFAQIPPGGEALSTRELWSAAVGVFLPLLVAIPIQPGWPTWGRTVFGIVCITIAGVITAYLDGALVLSGFDAILRSILLVGMASWSSYVGVWKNTVAPHIERAVLNLVQPPAPEPPAPDPAIAALRADLVMLDKNMATELSRRPVTMA